MKMKMNNEDVGEKITKAVSKVEYEIHKEFEEYEIKAKRKVEQEFSNLVKELGDDFSYGVEWGNYGDMLEVIIYRDLKTYVTYYIDLSEIEIYEYVN